MTLLKRLLRLPSTCVRELFDLPPPAKPPPVGQVRFGDLRRVTPIEAIYGWARGLPIDRYYIEKFLATHAECIRGHTLEVGQDDYTRQFGGARVEKIDVLHVVEGNPKATLVADFSNAPHLPANTFDCAVITQTLQLIYALRAAVATLHRLLKPGGVVLATFPGISHISRHDPTESWDDRWCWHLTQLSARRLFGESFAQSDITVEAFGNVLAAVAFLHGLATHEFRPEELDHRDIDYDLLIGVKAIKR
jgi:SAM-dependent methyltransferase